MTTKYCPENCKYLIMLEIDDHYCHKYYTNLKISKIFKRSIKLIQCNICKYCGQERKK